MKPQTRSTDQLRIVQPADAGVSRADVLDAETLATAGVIVERVRSEGRPAFAEYVDRFGDREVGTSEVYDRDELSKVEADQPIEVCEPLRRAAARIRSFAKAQRASLRDLDMPVPGGRAGHRVMPLERAGCYAPGGRFPLPSTVLMTAVTARAAGVRDVTVVSPRPTAETLAAASIAGADRVIAAGGAHGIAGLAFGVEGLVDPVDVIVGPGNRWVTAAKKLVAGTVRIDMLAGPSELLIIADASADPAVIAADLLAQAEHDPDACAMLVSLDDSLPDRVNAEIAEQLRGLPTRDTAEQSLVNGWMCVVGSDEEAAVVSDRVAPEHLQLLCDPERSRSLAERLRWYGGLFEGHASAEVFGDYGAGPNHTLPTGGTGRSSGGLSVLDFLAVRTWLRVDDAGALAGDTASIARMEGLQAHARAAEIRVGTR